MKKINKDTASKLLRNENIGEIIKLKEYKTPELENYGDISELVLMNAGIGPDGFPIPPMTFST